MMGTSHGRYRHLQHWNFWMSLSSNITYGPRKEAQQASSCARNDRADELHQSASYGRRHCNAPMEPHHKSERRSLVRLLKPFPFGIERLRAS